MRVSGRKSVAATVLLAAAVVALAGCSPSGQRVASVPTPISTAVHPELGTTAGTRVIPDIVYGHAGGRKLLLDACLPEDESTGATGAPTPRASIVMIHGGSWTRGDKAEPAYRAVCQWLAANGYPTFAVDYRMDPAFIFPAAFDDVRTAVAWLRKAPQLGRFALDPSRIGAFGGSAGGNLASLLGTVGTGPLTEGTRVSAVVELSGPADLTGADATPDFIPVQLAFLGCASETDCPAARAASPILAVSRDDPPFFVANSTAEKIPIEQSIRFVTALRAAGVPTTFVKVKGGLHSIAMLSPTLRASILSFYASSFYGSTLGTNASASLSDSGTGANSGAG